MKSRTDLISSLKQQLEENYLIVGLVLVGSEARIDNYSSDKYSDIEAYIIVKDGAKQEVESQLPELVKNLGNVIFSYKNRWSGFSTVFKDLTRLELPVVEISEAPEVFSRPKAQSIKVLIDKTVGKLNGVLKKRPDTIDYAAIFAKKVDDFWYMSIVACQYFKRGELYNSISALHITNSAIIRLFEMLQDPKILLLESNKRIEKFISSEQESLLKELLPTYDKQAVKSSLKRSFAIFIDTAEKASLKYKFNYDAKKWEKIKERLVVLLNN